MSHAGMAPVLGEAKKSSPAATRHILRLGWQGLGILLQITLPAGRTSSIRLK